MIGRETFTTSSVVATSELGRELAQRLNIGDCVALQGELGAGKTALVRGLALGLGLSDERMVSSPTFVLVQEYPGRIPIFHLDLYRLSEPEVELAELGLDEMLRQGVVLIEWAQRAERGLPRPRWQIDIEITGPRRRQFHVSHIG